MRKSQVPKPGVAGDAQEWEEMLKVGPSRQPFAAPKHNTLPLRSDATL